MICGRIPLAFQLASELITVITYYYYYWPRVAFAERTHCAPHSDWKISQETVSSAKHAITAWKANKSS